MPPTHISHYKLTDRLGGGTFGEVWKGVHVDDPAFVVAVKLVHPSVQGDPSFIAALREECRALDRMDHSGIVRFRELVVRDGVVAMVLELLEGEDLEAALAAGPQQIAEVERIVERALEALAYAHAAGVLHRDIKPGNLFRCRDGRVKLMDFGLARASEGSRGTKTGTLKGTMDYMAPERFRGQTSAAADVYALGLVAWELLAGRRAAPAGDLPAKMGWHWAEGPPNIRTVRADCPVWLASLVTELTSREVMARPADGSAALARLRALRGVSAPGAGPAVARPVVPGTVEVRLPARPPAAVPSRNISAAGGASARPGSGTRGPSPAPAALSASGRAPTRLAAASRSQPQTPSPSPDLDLTDDLEPVDDVELIDDLELVDDLNGAPPAKPPSRSMLVAVVGVGLLGLVGLVALAAVLAGWRTGRAPVEAGRSGYALRLVPAGTYQVGCTVGQGGDCHGDEKPSRSVTLSRSVLMGETEVTQGLYSHHMGSNPSQFAACGLACPVETVSWFDAVAFANKLSESEGLEPCYVIRGETVTWPKGVSCLGYRLPTEAEWEVSARGGRDDKYPGGGDLSAAGWFSGNSGDTPHPVGQKRANGYGLYDMSGNVWEWTWDWYDSSAYSIGPAVDPAGPASGAYRVYRGGSWYYVPQLARVAVRGNNTPHDHHSILGFRLLKTAAEDEPDVVSLPAASPPPERKRRVARVAPIKAETAAGADEAASPEPEVQRSGAGATMAGDPIILGTLDKSLIDAVIKRNMNQIRYCYQRGLTNDPSLGGTVTVKFVIAKDGSVSKAEIKQGMGNKAVEGCIAGRFLRFKFPEPEGGGIVIVSYPFIFSPD